MTKKKQEAPKTEAPKVQAVSDEELAEAICLLEDTVAALANKRDDHEDALAQVETSFDDHEQRIRELEALVARLCYCALSHFKRSFEAAAEYNKRQVPSNDEVENYHAALVRRLTERRG